MFDNLILYKRLFPRPNKNIIIERAFFSSWLGAELCRLAQILRKLGNTLSRRQLLISYLDRDGSVADANNNTLTQDPRSRLEQLDARVRELLYNLGKVSIDCSILCFVIMYGVEAYCHGRIIYIYEYIVVVHCECLCGK